MSRIVDKFRFTYESGAQEATLRFDANTFKFELEVMGKTFTGENARLLKEEARLFVKGAVNLDWKPIITIDPEVNDELVLYYGRYFTAKKGREVFWRAFRVKDLDEDGFGLYRNTETGDVFEGVPGNLIREPSHAGKAIPYTPKLWAAVRLLDSNLKAAVKRTKERLKELLSDKDVATWIEHSNIPNLVFTEERK